MPSSQYHSERMRLTVKIAWMNVQVLLAMLVLEATHATKTSFAEYRQLTEKTRQGKSTGGTRKLISCGGCFVRRSFTSTIMSQQSLCMPSTPRPVQWQYQHGSRGDTFNALLCTFLIEVQSCAFPVVKPTTCAAIVFYTADIQYVQIPATLYPWAKGYCSLPDISQLCSAWQALKWWPLVTGY